MFTPCNLVPDHVTVPDHMTDLKMTDQKMSERSKEKNREIDRKKMPRKALADFDQGLFQNFS